MNDAAFRDFATEPLARVKGIADFLREYKPIKYTVDGLLPGGSIYGVTAKRGAGKTALLTSAALAVATGEEKLLGLEVEQGRVAYIILENPTDFRMKLSAAAFAHNIDVQALNDKIAIFDMRRPHEQVMELLRRDASRFGEFQLINYDTFQAGFPGANFNDNAETLKHAQSLRELTTLPGGPSVLVACHPVKNADKERLEPYGGGSTMNELDGNITAWNEGGIIEIGFNKVRGPEFEPFHFRVEKIGTPDVLDIKGRQPLLPVLFRATARAAEEREAAADNQDVALLKALAADPGSTKRGLATAANMKPTSMLRALERLESAKGGKLVKNTLGKWALTPAGHQAIKAR